MTDIQADAALGADEFEELVFDGPDDFAAPAAPVPQPAPGPTSRKRIARSAKAEAPAAPAAPEPDLPPSPEPVAPAAVAPSPTAAAAPRWLLPAALGVALLAAMLATVGLLMATRTIAATNRATLAAQSERAELARLPATLARLDDVVTHEQAALARLGDGRAGAPATLSDLHRELDALRIALAARQPQRDTEILDVVRSGQSEITDRLAAIGDRLDHLRGGAAPAATR